MLRKIKTNQKGLTYIELLVAIGIIAILSTLSMFYIKTNAKEDIRRSTEQLAADIRLARNMSISRTTTKFNDGTTGYPEGGYGIYFVDPSVSTDVSYYILYAARGSDGFDGGQSNGDKIIKRVDLPKADLAINDVNSFAAAAYFSFATENSIVTNLSKDYKSNYTIEVSGCILKDAANNCTAGYRGIINLGEKSGDQYTMSNVGVSYGAVSYPVITPPPPDPGGAKGMKPSVGGDVTGTWQ